MDCFGGLVPWIKSIHRRRRNNSKRLVIGHPTDFRRVEFTMPHYDKEDALSDETPSDSSALYHISKRDKLYHEAKMLKEKLAENTDGVRLRLLRHRI
ncbi:hypothetical protein AJ78_05721 [Emergomyces pasteurianus Ep9510]|uniref:Uncharacterized protein n=1 Tax=Emergomyces pasteurianus Ep9510 TaxID=1447872 RepID=A0A1J9PD09_9EURO|nr:hypothetical protein AJ78_05721 [Emergomyces pasteurianus Ep9510]